jgi:hypothetical protein
MIVRFFLALALTATLASHVKSSQVPAHVYVALKALESAPPEVKEAVHLNLDAYLCGSAGPDIAYTAHYVQLGAGALIGVDVFPPGTEGHGDRPGEPPKTGELIRNMFKIADVHKDYRETAFALGWMTHCCVDNVIHPLVNQYGGYYADDAYHHKILEMMESEHVLQKKDAGDQSLYVLNPNFEDDRPNVPVWLVCNAYAETFPRGVHSAAYKPTYLIAPDNEVKREFPPAFTVSLRKSAENVRQASQAIVDTHNGKDSGYWAKGILRLALKGPPPTPEEYQKLMNPVKIDSVRLEATSPGARDGKGFLVVDYTLNDPRLLKMFCDAWDKEIQVAVQDCLRNMVLWSENPTGYRPADVNLNTGPGGFDRKAVWPGKPDTRLAKVRISITDDSGRKARFIRPDGKTWSDDGELVWSPIVRQELEIEQQYKDLGRVWADQVELISKGKIWGCNAGQVRLKAPYELDPTGPVAVAVDIGYEGVKDADSGDSDGSPRGCPCTNQSAEARNGSRTEA